MWPLDHGHVQAALKGQVGLARRKGKHSYKAAVRQYGPQILSIELIARFLSAPKTQRTPGGSLSAWSRQG
ncbi:hypothetical protein DPMN_109632 [Dreissena polymorpha]|uniref:Uncharacterized protein n=1 Tax=Dreissena polymorpha TaxID=45954 RepID=A0A9D4KBD9_DREPO|nr:hypothetical protein DPMN_109632 [Dreissena polymorpha]